MLSQAEVAAQVLHPNAFERSRQMEALCDEAGMSKLSKRLIASGMSVEDARNAIFDGLCSKHGNKSADRAVNG